jgi:hypothetical protein
MGADIFDWERVHGPGSYQDLIDGGCSGDRHEPGCSHREITGRCEHRHTSEAPCGARSAYVVSVGRREHDAREACRRHLSAVVDALAGAKQRATDITVRSVRG